MEYYAALEGEKIGPLTQFKLVEMLKEGEITPENKIWHKGLDGWIPMNEVASMRSIVEAFHRGYKNPDAIEEEKTDEEEGDIYSRPVKANTVEKPEETKKRRYPVAVEVRPLTRYWARQFDYMLVMVCVVLFSDVTIPKADPNITLTEFYPWLNKTMKGEEMQLLSKMMFWALMIWHPIEGILISLFKTTPGKALFGIFVKTPDGGRPSILQGLARSFLVYILGVALFNDYLMFAAMTFSFFILMTRGATLWDQGLGLRVSHPPLSFARVLLAIGAFLALMTIPYLNFS